MGELSAEAPQKGSTSGAEGSRTGKKEKQIKSSGSSKVSSKKSSKKGTKKEKRATSSALVSDAKPSKGSKEAKKSKSREASGKSGSDAPKKSHKRALVPVPVPEEEPVSSPEPVEFSEPAPPATPPLEDPENFSDLFAGEELPPPPPVEPTPAPSTSTAPRRSGANTQTAAEPRTRRPTRELTPLDEALQRMKKRKVIPCSEEEHVAYVNQVVNDMLLNFEKDAEALATGKPGLNRIRQLSSICEKMVHPNYRRLFCRMGGLDMCVMWLKPIQGNEPNLSVRRSLVTLIGSLPMEKEMFRHEELKQILQGISSQKDEELRYRRECFNIIDKLEKAEMSANGM
jgi:hypothetical protein